MNSKHVIVIGGPTASGKTDLAIQLAQKFNTQIINADSRQCYVELNIGVAKPSMSQLQSVPHHFINSYSVLQHRNAMDFADFTEKTITRLLDNHDLVVVSGGTGLYLKAWMDGLDNIPSTTLATRQYIKELYENDGIDSLLQILQMANDPFVNSGEIQNPARVIRAAEIQFQFQKSITSFYNSKSNIPKNYTTHSYYIAPEREWLVKRITTRTETMMRQGLWEEAESLMPYSGHKNLATVGYQEIFEAIRYNHSLIDTMNLISIHTRQYAKRQMTWFRNQGNYLAISHHNALENIISDLSNKIKF